MPFNDNQPGLSFYIGCGDNRLWELDPRVSDFFEEVDAQRPLRSIFPGGCALYSDNPIFERVVRVGIRKGARHFEVIDHMGDEHTPGCAVYYELHEEAIGTPGVHYPNYLEMADHLRELRQTAEMIRRVASDYNEEVTINTGLFVHDKVGEGYYKGIFAERPLPGLADALASMSHRFAGSRPS